MAGSGREVITHGLVALPEGLEWLEGLPGELGVVGRLSQRTSTVWRPLRRVGKPSRRALSG